MIYRTEHPKPQFMRETWKNLNGEWQFEIDSSQSGIEKEFFLPDRVFSKTIQVPFCPESKLSGLEHTDFLSSVWYKRDFDLEPDQLQGRTVLHFGAVDYEARVYVNGNFCGSHRGGYVSFSLDITDFVVAGRNTITVQASDDTRSNLIPSGKQSTKYHSYLCYYTRSTGIWQTVWLEFTPRTYIKKVRYFPNADAGAITLRADLCGAGTFKVEAFFDQVPMGQTSLDCQGGQITLTLPLKEKHLWQVGEGGLYDLKLSYGQDRVSSYFGLRTIEYRDRKFYLNGNPLFQRLILDQGYYPDGIYTAPDDRELSADIDRSMAMGFNGARLHQKVFEERFLYHCDRKGYLTWGEYPSWGIDMGNAQAVYRLLDEWMEVLERDMDHPSIVGWCPLNETWSYQNCALYPEAVKLIYNTTRAVDPERPCIDTSGGIHVKTDIYDLHSYEQNPDVFKAQLEELGKTNVFRFHTAFRDQQRYDGVSPFFISEYGGIAWEAGDTGWGYGNAPTSKEEFLERLKGLTDTLLNHPLMFGFCYTQLTDVEQEKNGLYTYDRVAKFSAEEIRAIFEQPAACEKES